MMKELYVYLAVFHYISGVGISVDFPDLPGCVASGAIDEIAIEMAEEALKFHLYQLEQNEEEIPVPSKASEIRSDDGDVIVQVKAWMPSFRNEMRKACIRTVATNLDQDFQDLAFPIEEIGIVLSSA